MHLIQSPAFVTLLLMFYWVPFAVGAWFADCDGAGRTRAWLSRHRGGRHIEAHRPVTA